MYNDKIVDMIVRQHNVQNITTKRLKIHSIHKDIIRLKQENRNIGDKIKSTLPSGISFIRSKQSPNNKLYSFVTISLLLILFLL